MIAAMLEDGPTSSATRGRGPRRGTTMNPMRMGPMGRMGGNRVKHHTRNESAMEVLRRRYAAGELTDEEFDTKRRRLEDRST